MPFCNSLVVCLVFQLGRVIENFIPYIFSAENSVTLLLVKYLSTLGVDRSRSVVRGKHI